LTTFTAIKQNITTIMKQNKYFKNTNKLHVKVAYVVTIRLTKKPRKWPRQQCYRGMYPHFWGAGPSI